MRLRHLAAALVLVLASCSGTSDPSDIRRDATPEPATASCNEDVANFVDALFELDSRLNVGMNFADYSERVGDVRVAYDRIDVEDLDADCVTRVGAPAEDAMNLYIRAYTRWNECVGESGCTLDSIESRLQKFWADATELVEKADDALER